MLTPSPLNDCVTPFGCLSFTTTYLPLHQRALGHLLARGRPGRGPLDKPIVDMENAQLGLARVHGSLGGLPDELISGVMAELDAAQNDFSGAYIHVMTARVLLTKLCDDLVEQMFSDD